MISTLFSSPISFVFSILALLSALTIHELAHAWVADRLGDPTARLKGRISLNPLVHIDLSGLLFLLFFGFGWGKPVLIDPYNLKNPRKDTAIIALAGPLINIILAIILSFFLRLSLTSNSLIIVDVLKIMITTMIVYNIGLGIFNLVPIYPLDGFKIVGGLLPKEKAQEWQGLERMGFFFLLALIFPIGSSSMLDYLIRPVMNFFYYLLIPVMSGGIV